MPKRRRSRAPKDASPADISKARRLVSQAFREKGKGARAARQEVQSRVRARMTDFVKERFLQVETKAQARGIQKRMSLAGAAHRVAESEARAAFTRDRTGRWHREDGRLVSAANMKRSQSMRAYWNQVKIIANALELNTKQAREVFRLGGGEEGWKELVKTP